MYLYTREEAGVEKAPPFRYANAGQYAYYKMLMANVPAARRERATVGGLGRLFWLALIVVNLAAGLLAAASLVKQKVPQLEVVYAKLTPMRDLVGLVALAVGILCFLRVTVFHFSPLADILPQLTAVLAGLLLGKERLLRKVAPAPEATSEEGAGEEPGGLEGAAEAAGDAAKKAAHAAQDLLIKHREQIERLEKYQVPVGIACLVTGLLHLLMGGVILF
jgi:hypothetical protein